LFSALSSRLGFTHYSFSYIVTTYIIIARREVRLQAAVETGQHPSSRLGFTHESFPYIETTYIIVSRWQVRLQAAVEAGQRAIMKPASRLGLIGFLTLLTERSGCR
jgi:hypothetical protein